MALLGFEGFEHKYPIASNSSITRGVLSLQMGSAAAVYSAGRFGGSALKSTNGADVVTLSALNATGLYMGAAFYVDQARSTTDPFFAFYGPESTGGLPLSSIYVLVTCNTAGQLVLSRGGTALAVSTTPTPVLTMAAWNYIEAYCGPFSATTGRIIVRVNGVVQLDYTGNTLGNSGSTDLPGNINYARMNSGIGSGNNNAIDDLYVCDDTGSAPYNTFLGDVRVETLVPNAAGSFTQLTPSTAPNWDCVNEQPAVATDYVGSPTIGQRDTYQFTDLVATNMQVLAVQTHAAALKSDAGVANIKTIERLAAGTERLSAALALPASLGWLASPVRTTDPASAAWTTASVNGSQFGVEVA